MAAFIFGHLSMPRPRHNLWPLLLAVPMLASLWIPLYNRLRPTLWGIPFFYWYLLAWVPLTAVFNAIVIRCTRSRKPPPS